MKSAATLSAAAYYVGTASLALVLVWFGAFKFTPTEAAGIAGLVQHSPILRWLYQVLSVAATAHLIGVVEMAAGLGLLAGWFWPPAGVAGAGLASLIFLTTSTFLLSTPGVFEQVDGMWVPGADGAFLIKDLALLAVALSCAAHTLRAAYATSGSS